MAISAQQVTTTGPHVMVGVPTDPRNGSRTTVCVFVNNPSDADEVSFAVEVYNTRTRTSNVIHEGELQTRESVVIDSPIEINSPQQLRLRVDSMPDPPINFYVHYTSTPKDT